MLRSNNKTYSKERIFANIRFVIIFLFYIIFIDRTFLQNILSSIQRFNFSEIESFLGVSLNFGKFVVFNSFVSIQIEFVIFTFIIVAFCYFIRVLLDNCSYEYTIIKPSYKPVIKSETVESGRDIYKLTNKFIC